MPTTLNLAITDGADDGYSITSTDWDSSTLLIGHKSTGHRHGGLRFENVTIPRGAKIVEAINTIYKTANNYVTNVPLAMDVHCADVDDAPEWSSSSGENPASIALTSAWTDVSGAEWPDVIDLDLSIPVDITAAVQEVINRAGWESGNALSVVWFHNGGLFGNREAECQDWDFSSGSGLKSELDITYVVPRNFGNIYGA